MKNLWQIAAGEPHRYFEDIFFKYGLMIMGPSHLGSAKSTSYASGASTSKGNQVNNFANHVEIGDRVIVRKKKEIIGIGEIQEGSTYQFFDQLGCILGWDLCHTWNVSWNNNTDTLGKLPNPFRNANQKQIPTFTKIHHKETWQFVEALPTTDFKKNTNKLPTDTSKKLSDDELRIKLFQRGLSSSQIESIIAALRQCKQLHVWYNTNKHSGGRPTEHEVISHLTLPLFLALGWSHQQIAVEWKRVDVALFLTTPTESQNCVGIVEAKGHGDALGNVLSQPEQYVKKLKLDNVRKIIITDGSNIFIHDRVNGIISPTPSGYLNTSFITESYFLPENASAIDALIKMLPSQF